MRFEAALRGIRKDVRAKRKIAIEIQSSGAEIPILQADIDILADSGANSRNALERDGAIAVAQEPDSSKAGTTADKTTPAAIFEINQPVDHSGEDIDMTAHIDRVVGQRRIDAVRSIDSEQERLVEIDVLNAGVLVRHFTFDPEHAEVVTADNIAIEPVLVIDVETLVVMSDAAWNDRICRHREIGIDVHVGVPWRQDAEIDPHIR